MTLQQVQYVLEISRCGSISAAAQELCLTQPYLSSVLRDLEVELQITIFNRSRKGVVLTDAGTEFLYYARPLLDHQARILNLYASHQRQPPFRFAISTQRYPFVIQAFCQFFKTLSPDRFDIYVRECSMEQVIRDVSEKRSDLGIIFLTLSTDAFIRRYLSVRNLEFNKIVTISPCVFFHKNHPMAIHEEVDLELMQSYPFASFESTVAVSSDFAEEALLANATSTERQFHVFDRGTMINILTHTDAFSIGTGILSKGFAGPELVSRPIKGHQTEICLGWIQGTNTPVSEEAAAFIGEVKQALTAT